MTIYYLLKLTVLLVPLALRPPISLPRCYPPLVGMYTMSTVSASLAEVFNNCPAQARFLEIW